jgi:type VI secretion system protein VasI
MGRLLGFLVVLGLGATPAAAQGGPLRPRLRECARISVRLDRLRCFDEVVSSLPRDSAGSESSEAADWRAGGSGDWVVDESVNPLDDTPMVVVSLKAASGAAKSGEAAELVLRCLSARTEVYLNWNAPLGRDGAAVTTRVGAEPALTRRWGLSTDARETFYPADDIAFIRQLAAVDRLVAQAVPAGEDPIVAVFQLRGLEVALTPLRAACKW